MRKDREATQSTVEVSWKHPALRLDTASSLRKQLVLDLFESCLDSRLVKLCRQSDPPFISASASSADLVQPVKLTGVAAAFEGRNELKALRALLVEFARIRLYGFSQGEFASARAKVLADVEQHWLEREQQYCNEISEE